MEKRGTSHIEVILAFVLFIGFVGFAIYFFNPVKNPSMGEVFSDNALNEIVKNASVQVISYSIKINETPIAVKINELPPNYKVRAEDYNENVLSAETESGIVYLNANENDFVILKFSEDFSENGFPERPIFDPANYEIASVSSNNVLSEKRIEGLKKNYDERYESIKDSLRIPQNKDFSIQLILDGGESIIAEKTIEEKIEVYSVDKKLEVLGEDGVIRFGQLIVKT